MTDLSIKVNGEEISSFDNALRSLMDEAGSRFLFNGTLDERFEAFAWLYGAGIMSFRGAVATVVREMRVSKPTVHKWIKKIEASNG